MTANRLRSMNLLNLPSHRASFPPILLLCLFFLIAVLIYGKEIGGAKRWIRYSFIGFQPSELAKLALVFFVAYYCDRKKSKIESSMAFTRLAVFRITDTSLFKRAAMEKHHWRDGSTRDERTTS